MFFSRACQASCNLWSIWRWKQFTKSLIVTRCQLEDSNSDGILDQVIIGLQVLDLSHNHILKIPECIFLRAKNIRSLDLSHNLISEVPEEVGLLTKLEVLFLQGNLFKSIPRSLASLKLVQFGLDWFKYSVPRRPQIITGHELREFLLSLQSLGSKESFTLGVQAQLPDVSSEMYSDNNVLHIAALSEDLAILSHYAYSTPKLITQKNRSGYCPVNLSLKRGLINSFKTLAKINPCFDTCKH